MTRRFTISSAFIVVAGCLAPESSIGTPIESEAMASTSTTTGQTESPAPDDTGNASKTSTSGGTSAGSAPGETGDPPQTSTSGGTQEVSCDGYDEGEPNDVPAEAECLDSRLEARMRTLCPHDDVDVYRIEIPDDGSDPTGGEAAFLGVGLVLPGDEDHLSAILVVLYDETFEQVLTSGNGAAFVPNLGPGVYFVELRFRDSVPANIERMEYGVVADVNGSGALGCE